MNLPLHQIEIVPPLNEAEQRSFRRQDSWTVSEDGSRLSYDSIVDSVASAVEWLEIFIERLSWPADAPAAPPGNLLDQGFTFDHTLNGLLWLRGHEEDAVLQVSANQLKVIRIPEPLNGFDWPALLRSRAWLIEQDSAEVTPLIGLLDALADFLRSRDVPEQMLDPSDYSER